MLYKPPIPHLDVPVRPTTISGIVFQRVQRYVTHDPYRHPETGEMTVTMTVQVRHYLTNADGTAGADAAELVKPYLLTYRADNTEAVDPATGEIVSTLTLEAEREAWLQSLENDSRTLMLRGTAFLAQMHAGPVDTVAELIAAMEAADGAPWYRFGGRPA